MYNEMIRLEVRKAMDIARAAYPTTVFKNPRVIISNRMTRCGGTCSYMKSKPLDFTLTFSGPIMERNDITTFIDQTVYHEVAHIVTLTVWGVGGHGDQFKHVMRNIFNRTWKESSRTHSFKTPPKRKMTRYVWSCPCGHKYEVTGQKHKKYSESIRKPFHPACGESNGRVYFTGRTVKV